MAEQIEDVIGIDASGAIRVSAKTGVGIVETLEAIVTRSPPLGRRDAPLKAMLVDSGTTATSASSFWSASSTAS